MRFEHRSQTAVLAGHVKAGVLSGACVGAVLYLVEVVVAFRGRYILVGDPLAKVAFVYLAAFATAGLLGAIVIAAISGRTRFARSPGRYTPFYFVFALYGGAVLWTTRDAGLAMLRHLGTTSAGLPYLAFLLVGLVVTIFWGNALHRHKRALWFGRFGRVALIVLMLTFIGAFFAGKTQRSLPGDTGRTAGPNVVLIVLDALRPDYMSLYGYGRPTTPNLDKLGEEGVVFDTAYSHGNRTVIAMPSLFTSLYPSFHGAIGYKELVSPLPEDRETIAEMLRDEGYTTVALMTNIHLKSIFGMTQGFDRVDEFNGGCYDLPIYRILAKLSVISQPTFSREAHPNATEVTDGALEWLGMMEDRPFFLYLHYMDTHHPYSPPADFARAFDTTAGNTSAPDLFRDTVELLKNETPGDLDEQGLQQLKDYYAGAIAYADDEIGRVLEAVRDMSNDRETIVIVTSDHGDEFLEHGTLYHNNLVIEELIRVPLILWSPQRFDGGKRVRSIARHIDVMPTIADLTGAVAPGQVMGESLLPLLSGDADEREVTVFAEGDFCTALRRDKWKLVYVDSSDTYALYDIEEDPSEANDLSERRPKVLENMRLELDEYLERAWASRRKIHQTADPETLRQLKALGYL